MSEARAQSTYQVRLDWGSKGLTRLAQSGIVIVVDAIGDAQDLAREAVALPHAPVVFIGSLRNATATAQAAYDEQITRGERTSINLILAGHDGDFAVEDYLAAGAIADALTNLGIDHSAPDVAVATEGFRPLTRAVKHLFSASGSGQEFGQAGRKDEAKAAAEYDSETEAIRVN